MIEERSGPSTQKGVRWLSMSGRKLRTRRLVSHSRAGPALFSRVACWLTRDISEVTVTEADDILEAEASQSFHGHDARETFAREKKDRKAARWRTQPSKAPLDSQESCTVS